MNEKETEKQNKSVEVDPEEIHEGACQIKKFGAGKISICKENGKIKIFEVEKEE